MSVQDARTYREKGIASWYGYETRKKKGGHMTANGEVFDPNGLNAAHKYLPLPTHVRVTNLENNRSIILRVNDRGPFVKRRIIDLSAGAARKLGYFKKGTARVLVETVELEGSKVTVHGDHKGQIGGVFQPRRSIGRDRNVPPIG
jgi:rare lipoprotein A